MKNLQFIALFVLAAALSWYLLAELSIRPYISLIFALFALQLLLNYILETYLVRKLKSKYFHMIIAPGTIIHEASHALIAKMLGCDITKIAFFTGAKSGVLGFVEYCQPADKAKGIRSLLISFAPFFGCGIFLIAILNYLALQNTGLDYITPTIVEVDSIDSVIKTAGLIVERFYNQLLFLDLSNLAILVIFYLEFSFALGSAPSIQDIGSAINSLLEYKLEALSMLMLLISTLLIIEYSAQLDPSLIVISQAAETGLKWIILILMISTLMLFAAVPFSYLFVETMEVKGAVKIIPPTLFLITYILTSKYSDAGMPAALAASFGMYLLSLLALKRPQYFLREGRRTSSRYY